MNKKTIIVFICIFVSALLCAQVLPGETGAAGSAVLLKVDSFREFAKSGFSFDFGVIEEGRAGQSLMRVYLNELGRDTSIAQYREPKKYSRRVVLALGNTFYVYDQGMPAPIRVTPREMLFGQASAGDITRISFSGMYLVESIEEREGKLFLRLKAIPGKGATYDLIDLTASAVDFRPVQADCKGASGIIVKTLKYETFETIGGKELLSGFTITELSTKKTSRVRLGNYSLETLPSSSFAVDALKYVR
jgi:hypothetical protein